MTTAMTDALAVALSFARRGWRPIPLDHPSLRHCTGPSNDAHDPRTCDKRGKHPAGKWGTIAAHDPAPKWLEHLFGREQRNVGIAVKPSGLIVLDEDELDALTRLAAELGHDLPSTYRVRTAAGWHWYFRAPDGVEIGNRTKGTPLAEYRIDVRGGKGDGGYVVGAGSLHASGHVYAAEHDTADVAPLPHWLVAMLTEDVQADEGVPGGPGPSRDPDDIRYDTLDRFFADYRRSVAACTHAGGVWREELFKAALDGWRLAQLDQLDPDQLVDDLNERARAVWGAGLDARDDRIVNVEARERARRSPWEIDNTGVEKIEKEPRKGETRTSDRYADLDIDLTAFLDGEVERTPTDRGMTRADGLPLLYRGKTHMAVGETEAGKSWLALANAMEEMRAGRRVLYVHFEESDPRDTVVRLRSMGARREWFAAGLFRFAGIEMPLAADRVGNLVDHFLGIPEDERGLAILDGVNAAMALHGMNPDKADEYGRWDQTLARPLAATGASVLSLDHVVKNPEAAARGLPGGTVMKINLVSGASFLMVNRDQLRPGAKGATTLYAAKDRPGSLREVGEAKSGRLSLLGTFWVDSTSALTTCSWTVPAPEEREEETALRPVDAKALKVLAVVMRLNAEPTRQKPPSTTELRSKSGVQKTEVAGLLDTLEAHALIAREKGDGPVRWLPLNPAAEKALQPSGTVHPDDL